MCDYDLPKIKKWSNMQVKPYINKYIGVDKARDHPLVKLPI